MSVLSRLLEWYRSMNTDVTELTSREALIYATIGLASYALYRFAVKPFLSPLRKIPGPGYNPLFGNVREAMVGEAMSSSVKWVKQYGGIVRFYHLLGRERVLIADPEALKHVFVTHVHKYKRLPNINRILGSGIFNVSGHEHTLQRRIMNPFFNHEAVQSYLEVFQSNCEKLMTKWRAKLDDDPEGPINVQHDLMCMALDSIGKTVFGYDFGALDDLDTPACQAFRGITSQPSISFLSLLPFSDKLPTKANREFQASVDTIDTIIYDIINRKRRQLVQTKESFEYAAATKDLLGKLMLARDEETGKGFASDQELRDQVLSLLIAGQETTASTMSWLLLLLSNHKEIQDHVRAEVTNILSEPGQPITWDHLDQMTYLTAVIKEGQRLYPVAPSFYRRVAESDVINGYTLPKGTLIVYHVGAMMRNPSIWNEPENFVPERFLGESAKQIDLYTHLPFIAGPHKCLGHQFAKMQMKIVLSNLMRNFTFTPIPGAQFKRKLRVTLKAVPPVSLNVAGIA